MASDSFIHGLAGNPLYRLAQEYKLKLFRPDQQAENPLGSVYSPEGPPLSQDISARLGFNSMRTLFSTAEESAQESPEGYPKDTESLADWVFDKSRSTLFEGLKSEEEQTYVSNLAKSWDGWIGASLDKVSFRYWQSDVTYTGPDATIVDGYRGIYEPLADIVRRHKGSDIKLSREVISLTYDEENECVTVETKPTSLGDKGQKDTEEAAMLSYTAPYVVCTLPLGVLQKSPPRFCPALSLRRSEAIDRIGMGLLNKVIVTYDKCFWPKDQPFLSFLPSQASEAFLPTCKDRALLAQNYYLVKRKNTLVFYLGAESGAEVEKLSDEQVKTRIHAVLNHHFGSEPNFPSGDNGPASIIVTRWLSDPYSHGSYSYIKPATADAATPIPTPYDYAELARPAWDEHLFFAGEATDPDHYVSMLASLEALLL